MAQKKEKRKKEGNKKSPSKSPSVSELKVDLEKIVIPEKKEVVEEPAESENNDSEFNGIDFGSELRRVLSFTPSGSQEVFIESSVGLEGSVASAPRIPTSGEEKGEVYDSNYEKDIYNENNYANQTPGMYSEKPSESGVGRGIDSGANSNSSKRNNSREQ